MRCSVSFPLSRVPRLPVPLLLALLAACGSGNDLAEPGDAGVATVTLSPATATLAVGDSLRLDATAHGADGAVLTGASIEWSSSAPDVATVDAGLVRARAAGTSRIVAASGGHADTAVVTVTDRPSGAGRAGPATRLAIGPHPDTLAQGDSLQLTASVTDSAGRPVSGGALTWSSSDSVSLPVSAAGVVRARGAGSGRIVVAGGALRDSATIFVRPSSSAGPIPARVALDPAGAATLTPDHCADYAALVYDSAGVGLPRVEVVWTSSDSTVASVTAIPGRAPATATVCGRGAGTAEIRATSGPASDSLAVTVNALPATTRVALGTLGGAASGAVDVNAAEVVVGWSEVAGGVHAFRWTAADGMRDLGTLGDSSIATAVNDAGYAAGTSRTATGERHVVLWTPAGELRDLGVPSVGLDSITTLAVNDLNAGNVLVGTACGSPGGRDVCIAFAWDSTRGYDSLAIPSGRVTATGINGAGDIVGEVRNEGAEGSDVYLLPAGGTFRDLGAGRNGHSATAAAINGRREIAGSDEPALSADWPNIWSEATGFVAVRPLDQFDEVAWGYGTDVNDEGEVVGFGDTGAFYWTRTGGFVVFDGAGTAAAINAGGTVVGEHARVASLWRGIRGATAPSSAVASRAPSLLRARARTGAARFDAVRDCVRERWAAGRARITQCAVRAAR